MKDVLFLLAITAPSITGALVGVLIARKEPMIRALAGAVAGGAIGGAVAAGVPWINVHDNPVSLVLPVCMAVGAAVGVSVGFAALLCRGMFSRRRR